MTDHPPDAGKKACRHVPRELIAAFVHVCKRCGVPIESVPCGRCDGMGFPPHGDWLNDCRACNGTGVASWRAAP